jgi:hypothetical protein
VTVPYLLRLWILCLGTFFVAYAAVGLLAIRFTPAAIRMAERMRPQTSARFLLSLRLLPLGAAAFMVLGICVPSYLWFEQTAAPERLGVACLIVAGLGACLWAISIERSVRACRTSARYLRDCRNIGRETRFPGESSPVCVVEGAASFLGLAGIVRPQVVISRDVVSALSASQLAAALRHEHAHLVSRDNLKRLLVLLAPDVVPFIHGFGPLERAWVRFAEWAADDRAVEGDSRRSLSLAAALVRVARIGSRPHALASCLIDDGAGLSARVDRLLNPAPAVREPARLLTGAMVLVAVCVLAVVLRPSTLNSGHQLLERLIH